MNKEFIGTVVSTKMQNTIVVSIETKFRHPIYRKVILRHRKLKAHNEDSSIKEGDMVTIRETRPISKDKHFIVVSEGNVKVMTPTVTKPKEEVVAKKVEKVQPTKPKRKSKSTK